MVLGEIRDVVAKLYDVGPNSVAFDANGSLLSLCVKRVKHF